MNTDEEKLDGASQEMENNDDLTDLEDEGQEKVNTDDDADNGITCEVRSTHSSLDGIGSSNDDSSDDDIQDTRSKERPIQCHKCGCNFTRLLGHECRAIKPHKPASSTPKLFKQSSSNQGEKEDTDKNENDNEVLSQHSSLDYVSSSSSSDSDVDYKPGVSALLPKNKTKNKPLKDRFECGKCKRHLHSKPRLTQHLLENGCKTIKTQFPCPRCDYRTVSKRHLDDHLLKRHNFDRSQLPGSNIYPTPFPFKCEECSRTYKWRASLIRHIRFDHCGSKFD